MNKFKLLSTGLWMVIIMALVFQSCRKDNDTIPVPLQPVDHQRGEIAEITSMGMYTVADIQQLLDATGEDFSFVMYNSVEAFSVKYYTSNEKGDIVLVSGAMFVPQKTAIHAIMSIQHGTETKRDLVASVSPENSTEGIIGLLAASMDYLVMVPDYPGFGASTCTHPYLHANSIVPSVIDFALAGKTYCTEQQIIFRDDLYLTGYSEGGYVSLLAQKVIEESYQDEFDLIAVAPLSGPYDLKGMFDKIIQDGSYSTPAYVAYVLTAYDKIYGWNSLEDFFQAPYAAMMPGLFDGTKSWGEIINALPESLGELLHPDFNIYYPMPHVNHNDFKSSGLVSALKENTWLDWAPQAPVHFFHGDCDDIVFCMNAVNAKNSFIANGAKDVQITIIQGGDHENSGPIEIRGALEWFSDFQPDQ